MADSSRALCDGLKATTEALVDAGIASQQAIVASQQSIQALQRAGAEVTKMVDAAIDAKDEREDLRETVARLESLVIAQGQDLRALRERLDRGGN